VDSRACRGRRSGAPATPAQRWASGRFEPDLMFNITAAVFRFRGGDSSVTIECAEDDSAQARVKAAVTLFGKMREGEPLHFWAVSATSWSTAPRNVQGTGLCLWPVQSLLFRVCTWDGYPWAERGQIGTKVGVPAGESAPEERHVIGQVRYKAERHVSHA
jgi:hypothetical protein